MLKHTFCRLLLCVLVTFALGRPISAKMFDGGVDSANLGKGDWIYYLSVCYAGMGGNVPSVKDAQTLFAWEKSQGMSHVIIKAGTGSTNYAEPGRGIQFTSSLVDAAHAAGLKIFGYTRSYGSDIVGESALADYVYNCGADGFVIDAEAEWEESRAWIGTNGPTLAWKLGGMIKTNWPTKFLAHAPMPIIQYHRSFPYKEFGYWCDAVMPQDYWVSFEKTPTATIQWMESNFNTFHNDLASLGYTPLGTRWTNAIKPLAPVGQADTAGQTAAEILEFVDYLRTHSYKGCSFWRADMHTAAMWEGIRNGMIGDYAPIITNQPQSQTIVLGQTVTFTVKAGGSPAPKYQWKFNGANLVGATRSSFARANTQYSDAGSYSVVVSNSIGSVVSDTAVLSVTASLMPPSITVQPQSATAANGQNGTFLVVAEGTTPLFYQWRRNGSAVSGATNSIYTTGTSGNYSVVITNSIGSLTSSIASLALVGEIIIDNTDTACTFQPGASSWTVSSSSTDRYGADYRYCSAVSGAATKTATYTPTINSPGCYDVYVWYPAGSNRTSSAPWTTAYSTGSETALVNQQSGGGGWRQIASSRPFVAGNSGYVRVANNASGGNVMADAVRFVYSAEQIPEILAFGRDQMVEIGGSASFFVYASGGGLTYQWRLNGSTIPGATNNAFSVFIAQLSNAGLYSVDVSNSAGTVTSSSARLTVGSSYSELAVISINGSGISLQIDGEPGNYVVEKSRNFTNWTTFTNVTITTGAVQCIDPALSQPSKFFRARSWP